MLACKVAASHPAARAQSAGPGPYSATRSRVGGKPGSSRAESVQARDGRAASPAVRLGESSDRKVRFLGWELLQSHFEWSGSF